MRKLAYYLEGGDAMTVPENDSASGYRVVQCLNQRWYVNCGGRMDVLGTRFYGRERDSNRRTLKPQQRAVSALQ